MFCFAGVLVLGALVSGAGATHSGVKRLSAGQINGNGGFNAQFVGASADGTRVFFETNEKLVAADTDNVMDIYERTGSTTQRVSAGQVNGNGAIAANFLDASANGTRVLFETTESLVPEDSDGMIDIYERFGGTTTKVSIGNSSASGTDAQFQGASTDGTRVFFQTFEQLTGDVDDSRDVYERVGATTQRVSAGEINGNDETGSWEASFRGASADGTKVFFITREQLVAADQDGSADIYQRSEGATTKITPGNGVLPEPQPPGNFDVTFAGNSADGGRVFFHTSEQLAAGDTDNASDLYQGPAGVRISTGQVNGNGEFDAVFAGASADGTKVFFNSNESLVSGDTDTVRDIYQRAAGQTKRVSAGAVNGNGNIVVNFKGASADGTRVFFETQESLVAGDTDGGQDIYQRAGGATKRVSAGQVNGNGPFGASFAGASADGTRVFFETDERLVSNDTGVAPSHDVYERASSQTSLVSLPPGGSFGATFAGASANGSAVFYETNEQVKNDSDGAIDIYGVYIAP